MQLFTKQMNNKHVISIKIIKRTNRKNCFYMLNDIENVANKILYSYWNLKIPVDVYQVAENIGFHIVENQNKNNNAILNLNNKTIIINNNESNTNNLNEQKLQNKFTIAHQLGHYVLNHTKTKQNDLIFIDDDDVFNGKKNYDYREVEANMFAARLLIPTDALREVMINVKNVTINDIAYFFQVKESHVAYRLNL